MEKHLVNGSLMSKYTGKTVRIWLNVGVGNSVGGRQVSYCTKLWNYFLIDDLQINQLEGMTSDGRNVKVNLSTPLNQPLNGWIEVGGVPNAHGSIDCSEVSVLSVQQEVDSNCNSSRKIRLLSSKTMKTLSH